MQETVDRHKSLCSVETPIDWFRWSNVVWSVRSGCKSECSYLTLILLCPPDRLFHSLRASRSVLYCATSLESTIARRWNLWKGRSGSLSSHCQIFFSFRESDREENKQFSIENNPLVLIWCFSHWHTHTVALMQGPDISGRHPDCPFPNCRAS